MDVLTSVFDADEVTVKYQIFPQLKSQTFFNNYLGTRAAPCIQNGSSGWDLDTSGLVYPVYNTVYRLDEHHKETR